MATYIIKAYPFPYVLGKEKTVKVKSDKDIDYVLTAVKLKIEQQNPHYEYDVEGSTLEDYIEALPSIEV